MQILRMMYVYMYFFPPPVSCFFPPSRAASPVSLRKAFLFKSCKKKFNSQKKSILAARTRQRDDFLLSWRAVGNKSLHGAPVRTPTFGFMARSLLQRLQQMRDDCWRKCRAFFFLLSLRLKPGYSNQQIKVNNRSYA